MTITWPRGLPNLTLNQGCSRTPLLKPQAWLWNETPLDQSFEANLANPWREVNCFSFLENKSKRNHALNSVEKVVCKYGKYNFLQILIASRSQKTIKVSCFAMKPAKNNLFLEKIQKSQFIEKLSLEHPGVTPK